MGAGFVSCMGLILVKTVPPLHRADKDFGRHPGAAVWLSMGRTVRSPLFKLYPVRTSHRSVVSSLACNTLLHYHKSLKKNSTSTSDLFIRGSS